MIDWAVFQLKMSRYQDGDGIGCGYITPLNGRGHGEGVVSYQNNSHLYMLPVKGDKFDQFVTPVPYLGVFRVYHTPLDAVTDLVTSGGYLYYPSKLL